MASIMLIQLHAVENLHMVSFYGVIKMRHVL